MKGDGLIRQPDGRLSTSDAFLYFFTGTMFIIWVGLGVAIFQEQIVWESYTGWFKDGVDFVYVSVIPYVAKRFSTKKGD